MTNPGQETATHYRPTESKYKGGAKEYYVTYDLDQRTRGDGHAIYPKVKRVYIAGDVTGWSAAPDLRKRTGKQVNGVRIEYEQSRKGYQRGGYQAGRGKAGYAVEPTHVGSTRQRFAQVVELSDEAKNIEFHTSARSLPAKYKQALQNVR